MERPNAGRRWSSGARRKTRLRGFGPVDQGGMRVISKRRGLTRGEDRRLFPRGAACHPELTRVIALMDDEDAEEAGPCGLLTERFRHLLRKRFVRQRCERGQACASGRVEAFEERVPVD